MKTSLVLLVASVALSAGQGHNKDCEEACKEATGLGASDCITECRVDTDSAPDQDEALAAHASEWTTNEAGSEPGGEAMEEQVEDSTGVEVPDCEAQVTEEPTFDEVDSCVSGGGDGVVSKEEMTTYANKMCFDTDYAMQMFGQADLNQDGVIDREEWEKAGEDTELEDEVDEAVDPLFEGDDEYKHVQQPTFEEMDANEDSALDASEVQDAVDLEIDRRHPEATEEQQEEYAEEAGENHDEIMEEADADGDGEISKQEFEDEDADEDLGDEMAEAEEKPDNPESDPDDLHRESPALFAAKRARQHGRHRNRQRGGRAGVLRKYWRAVRGAFGRLRARAARKLAAKARTVRHHKVRAPTVRHYKERATAAAGRANLRRFLAGRRD